MTMKKDLAALLNETAQQPLRRGRGLRLARASKQARGLPSKPSAPELPAAPEPSGLPDRAETVVLPLVDQAAEAAVPAAPPIAPDAVIAEADAGVVAPIASASLSDLAPPVPERDKRKLLLRKDLLKQCKRIARAQDRKLYQVVESALEEYIQRHGAPE